MCAQRFYAGGEGRDGVLGFFLLVVAGMVLWMSRGDLPTLGRAGQLFFAALLLGAGTVLVLSLPQLRPERVFPLYLEESGGILWGALPAAGVLGWSFYAAFLQQDVAEQGEDQKRQWRLWSLGGCGLLGLGQLVILGVLGVELARRVQSPFFLLAKGVSIQGGFQRVESIVAALWLFSDLTQAGVLVFALKKLFGRAFGEKWEKVCPWAAVLTALAAAFLPLWDGETLALFGGKLVPAGNLLLGLAVPALESLRRGLHRRRGA
jgi:hypothetical protein